MCLACGSLTWNMYTVLVGCGRRLRSSLHCFSSHSMAALMVFRRKATDMLSLWGKAARWILSKRCENRRGCKVACSALADPVSGGGAKQPGVSCLNALVRLSNLRYGG